MKRRLTGMALVLLGALLALASLAMRAGINGANDSVCWSQSAFCAVSLTTALAALPLTAAVLSPWPRPRGAKRQVARLALSALVPVLALVSIAAFGACDPPRNRGCTGPPDLAASSIRRL